MCERDWLTPIKQRHLAKMENAVKQRKTCYEEHLKEMRRWTAELDSEIASFSTSDAL